MLNPMPFLRAILPHPAQWLRDAAREGEGRECDPLAHPALRRMSLEELADLPFERGPGPARPDDQATGRERR